jgi:hypothetical protein
MFATLIDVAFNCKSLYKSHSDWRLSTVRIGCIVLIFLNLLTIMRYGIDALEHPGRRKGGYAVYSALWSGFSI